MSNPSPERGDSRFVGGSFPERMERSEIHGLRRADLLDEEIRSKCEIFFWYGALPERVRRSRFPHRG